MNRLKKLFSDYVRGKSTEDEKKIVDLWYVDKKCAIKPTDDEVEDFAYQAWKNLLQSREKQKRKTKLITLFSYGGVASAAVFLILLALWMPMNRGEENIAVNSTREEVTHQFTTTDNMKKITLADGSVVHMNMGTTLSLRKGKFNAYTREVWLDEGEAFFEVTKDPNRPFIVHTSSGLSTRVLGTSFNIKAYRELVEQVISVKTGLVQVSTKEGKSVLLKVNNKASFDSRDGELIPSTANGADVADWRNGHIVLEHVSLHELAFRLKQYYQVEVVNNAIPEDMEVYTSFTVDTPLEHVLNNIASIFNVSYHLKEGKVYFD